MRTYRCTNCLKYSTLHELCRGCGQRWTRSYVIPDRKLNAQNDRSYDLMRENEGKKMADKQHKIHKKYY